MSTITIKGRTIGAGHPAYIVAEISANHHQKFDEAVRLLHAAKQAGADAVKLQTYTADTMTLPLDTHYFQIGKGTIWEGQNLYALYQKAHTPWEWQPKLKKIGDDIGLDIFSSPFDASAVDFLERMDVPAYKIASFEVVDIPLIRRAARTKKPLIISTGMATLAEIEEAVAEARNAGATEIVLMKCTSAYPAPPEEMNLRAIAHLGQTFKVPVGLSDHTLGPTLPAVAVALGASVIEKHLTMSREVAGPDSAFSLEPQEFKAMAEAVRMVEKAMGTVRFGPSRQEAGSLIFRRSLFVVKTVKKGEAITAENVRAIRPGHGLLPRYFDDVLGRRAAQDIAAGTPLAWELLSGEPADGAQELSSSDRRIA